MDEFKPVVFRIGKERFGVGIDIVSGIENEIEVFNSPNSPEYIKGIINLRGEVIPLYSLRAKFKMPEPEESQPTTFIIVRVGEFSIALEVDAVEDIKDVDATKIYDTPPIIKSGGTGYLSKIINVDGKLIIIIDPMELLEQKEKEALKEYIDSTKND